jgi:hypothetical protein
MRHQRCEVLCLVTRANTLPGYGLRQVVVPAKAGTHTPCRLF